MQNEKIKANIADIMIPEANETVNVRESKVVKKYCKSNQRSPVFVDVFNTFD